MHKDGAEQFYLIHETMLPDAALKTLQVKQLLEQGEVKTINEAVERVGLSRSAFYKYKDNIFALDRLEREKIVTISMNLQHRSGILSQVLAIVASYAGNVLTINQSIPLQGMANVVISVEVPAIDHNVTSLLEALGRVDGLGRVQMIGQGSK